MPQNLVHPLLWLMLKTVVPLHRHSLPFWSRTWYNDDDVQLIALFVIVFNHSNLKTGIVIYVLLSHEILRKGCFSMNPLSPLLQNQWQHQVSSNHPYLEYIVIWHCINIQQDRSLSVDRFRLFLYQLSMLVKQRVSSYLWYRQLTNLLYFMPCVLKS